MSASQWWQLRLKEQDNQRVDKHSPPRHNTQHSMHWHPTSLTQLQEVQLLWPVPGLMLAQVLQLLTGNSNQDRHRLPQAAHTADRTAAAAVAPSASASASEAEHRDCSENNTHQWSSSLAQK